LKVRSHIIKRLLDLAATAITAPIWLPVLVTVALMVRAKIGTPVFFRQSRPGRNQKPFQLVKFRTMNSARDAAGNLLPDSERLTGFGRWLRSTSLDELPELINVLRGEMSLVGPRPLLMQYLARYSPRQARRHEVLPGITGWAQVNGRNAISWERKFELDVWYVENGSLPLDLKILLLTLTRVFARHGISAPGEATAPEFMGGSATQE
jgi:lipopolysaccharide/colanic/teichoic acid biosynthesis glycosyltransferase